MSDDGLDGLRYDSASAGLLDNTLATFSAIRNSQTGLGTARSKSQAARVNPNQLMLTREELEVLPYRDELIGKAIRLFPISAVNAWFHLAIADIEETDDLPDRMMRYLDSLGDRDDQTEEESNSEIYGVREAFTVASILAAQFGKAYILMGIDDGREFSEPVDFNNVRSLRWLQIYDNWDLRPELTQYSRRSPIHYRFVYGDESNKYGAVVHKSRLLPFYGRRIYSRRRIIRQQQSSDDGISIIQGLYESWMRWTQGEIASSEMLADYDTFTLGMKGLALSLEKDRRDGTSKGQEAILHRALTLDQGKSTTRGILYDLDNEEPGSVTRRYNGAKDIMDSLEKRWVAATGIPEFKLFGRIGGQGLTNNQGLAMRSEWAILVQDWSTFRLVGNMSRLCKVSFAAKDSPSKGNLPASYEVTVPFNIPLTDTERVEFEYKAAQRSQILVNTGAVSPLEVRTGYQGSHFNLDIMLSDDFEPSDQPPKPEKEQELEREDAVQLLTDEEWEELSRVTAAYFVEVAQDVSEKSVERGE